MAGLRGLARILNSMAKAIEEHNECDAVSDECRDGSKVEDKPKLFEDVHPARDRSGSVDSGFGDTELDLETGLELISLEEVSYHCTREDGWMLIYDNVYNVTEFLEKDSQPGGEFVMLEYLGYDATTAFRGVGHSREAGRQLEEYMVGILPVNERIPFME